METQSESAANFSGKEMSLLTRAVKTAPNPEFIFVKPLCDYFGLNYDWQVTRINKDPILQTQTGKNTDELLFGDKREHLTLTKRGFLRWVQIINPVTLQGSMKEKFEKFQVLVFDFLYGGNILKDQYINYVKKEYEELNHMRKDYSTLGNQIKNKRFHIEKVMGMAPGEWKELGEQELEQIEEG